MIFGYSAQRIIFGSLVAIEMIFFNMFTVDSCCQRKYSRWVTALLTALFTFAIIPSTVLVLKMGTRLMLETGNGLVLLVGWLYVPFCQLLYSGRFMRKVSIVFTTWSYTYFVYYIAVALVTLCESQNIMLHMFVVQSSIYLISGMFFARFVKRNYIKMLNTLTISNEFFLTVVTGIWFITIMIGSQAFMFDFIWLDTSLAILVGADGILSYVAYYRLSNSEIRKEELEKLAYTDALCQLNNRTKLYIDIKELLNKQDSFKLIYVDINWLKNINDSYGHSYGDNYIALFASKAVKLLGESGKMYRVSGDEFVCIYTGTQEHKEIFELALRNQLWMDTHPTIKYYGCGIGEAHYPKDGDDMDALLKVADANMYLDKSNKPKRFEL